jgi:hypothetical protein
MIVDAGPDVNSTADFLLSLAELSRSCGDRADARLLHVCAGG